MISILFQIVASAPTSQCIGTCNHPQKQLGPAGESMSDYMMKLMEKDLSKLVGSRIVNGAGFTESEQDLPLPILNQPMKCEFGMAGEFPCNNVNLLSMLPHHLMGGNPETYGNDIWGWVDTKTKREYALVGQNDGTAFVDITDPSAPVFKGRLPTKTNSSTWRDIKTIGNFAYIVSEAENHGVQVFDLSTLANPTTNQILEEYAYYGNTGRCHNIVANEETNTIFCVGSRNVCNGGLYMIDVSDPKNPINSGCYDTDQYTHDAQCVIYNGPDKKYRGREICFAFNEDTVSIVDITDRKQGILISKTGYDGFRYTHQGWLTEDHVNLMFNDELDEQRDVELNIRNRGKTTTYWMDVSSLEYPKVLGTYIAPVTAIDHNLYIKGNYAYLANYGSGLRILDIHTRDAATISEFGFFDIYPENDLVEYAGTWSSYPFLPSGNIIVNTFERGLFVLRPTY